MKKMKVPAALLLAAVMIFGSLSAIAPTVDDTLSVGTVEAEAAAGNWVASWSTASVEGTISLDSFLPNVFLNDLLPSKSTIRVELQLSAGGEYIRFRFSNEYGSTPLKIGAASVAKTRTPGTATVQEESLMQITFNDGQTSATIAPGDVLWSDSVYFVTRSLEYISVSIYFPSVTYIKTTGLYGGRTFLSSKLINLDANASQVMNAALDRASEVNITSNTITYHTVPFLSNVDVRSKDAEAYSVVFLGDSTLTNEAYRYYAQRAYSSGYSHIGFVNNAIVANRLLYDGVGLIGKLYGTAAIDRFQRDALDVTGCKIILVKIGLNDIIHPAAKSMKGIAPYASVEEIIAGYEQLIARAHAAGKKIYFFSNTAWKGYERSFLGMSGDLAWSQELQDKCDALDQWIKTNRSADGYFDMSPMDDPIDHHMLLPSFTTDGAHLTDLGAVAMADLIPASLIGAPSLAKAANLNNVDPYELARKEIASSEAAARTTTTAPSTQTPTRPDGGTVNTTSVNDAIASSVIASREAVEEASRKAAKSGQSGVKIVTTTTEKPKTTTTKKAETGKTTTKANNNTAAANGGATTVLSANTPTTAAPAANNPTFITPTNAGFVEPAGDNSSAVAQAGGNYSIDIQPGANPAQGVADANVAGEGLSSNGSVIGIVLVGFLVLMVAAAVVITVVGRKKGDILD